jgi:integrase
LTTYAYPILGDVPVADVNTELVLKVLQQSVQHDGKSVSLWNARTQTASRVRGRIERVLSSAKVRGLRDGENPAAWRDHLKEILPNPSEIASVEHHPALPYEHVPTFIARLRAKKGISALALEFTILTAVRTSEAIGATFNEFDLAAKVWTIPAERTKTEKEHRVPLAPRGVAIVKELAATRLNEFVFPGLKRGKPLSSLAMLMMLRDMHPGITVHGFRSSFRDWAGEETNAPHDICEAALAHTRGKTHAAYQRGDLLKKRDTLMQAWAEYCEPPTAAKRRRALTSRASAQNTQRNVRAS